MSHQKKTKNVKEQHFEALTATQVTAPKNMWKYVLLILGITFIVMSPALKNELVSWDDYAYIRDNQLLRDLSWRNIQHFFDIHTHVLGNYHPLTVLTLAIEYKFVGDSPFLYHLDNILLHLLNVTLVAFICWLLTKQFYTTLLATALFALHPMRVESVVWAAERKDVLYTFFFLAAMVQYIRYIQNGRTQKRLFIISLVLFLLSLLSKGQAVVLPLVLILLDYWQDGKFVVRRLADKIPFFILALLMGYLATVAQAASLTEERLAQHSLIERIQIAGYNILAYHYKCIAPFDLCCFYGYPPKSEWTAIMISPFIVVLLLGVLFTKFRKDKVLMFGFLFFLATIVIVIQLLPVGDAIIADRYTYLPYFGLFFLVASKVNFFISQRSTKKLTLALSSLVLVIFAGKTFLQSGTWKNNETLFLTVLKNNPNEPVAHNNLGSFYDDQKNSIKALYHFQQCVANRKTYKEPFKAYHNLGKVYSDLGQNEKSIEAYTQAIMIESRITGSYFGRGLVYHKIGAYDQAIADFDKVLQSEPKDAKAWYSRAMANQYASRQQAAISDYSRAIDALPTYAEAYMNRGNVYFGMGDQNKAIENYNKSLELDPGNGNTWMNRSKAWMMKGDPHKAVEDLRMAESLNVKEPNYKKEVEDALKSGAGNT